MFNQNNNKTWKIHKVSFLNSLEEISQSKKYLKLLKEEENELIMFYDHLTLLLTQQEGMEPKQKAEVCFCFCFFLIQENMKVKTHNGKHSNRKNNKVFRNLIRDVTLYVAEKKKL